MGTLTYQIQGDKRLLQFETYEEYLDSLVTPTDLCYLRSTCTARAIAELGYRNSGETLSREQFIKRRNDVVEALSPNNALNRPCSKNIQIDDPLLQELGMRERANRVGLLATIIFVRHFTKSGDEISGYIDYGERLKTENWIPFFQGKKRIWPRHTDLGFYHWKIGKSFCNSSDNYKAILDPNRGLLFQNRNDRKVVCVDPDQPSPGSNTNRIRIYTPKYAHVILYDHVVRRKC
ncbi:cilia- and flagella-associated protein 299-like [Anabrus simplex]|uniref:cilia- and flagella-associated protein 299-like n=1 Tax=Anabrus simplex TaxID=316456 RepID=UPI0035A35AF1